MSRLPTPPGPAPRAGLLVALVAAACAASASWPGPLAAQEVSFTPRPDRPEERQLKRFLEAGDFHVLDRDTVLGPDSRLDRPLLVLQATVRIAGRVEGSVYVVNGDLFLRPGARIGGEVAVLGGGYYSSSRASVEGGTVYRPNLLLRVVPREGGYEIFHAEEAPDAVSLDGLYGFHLPAYQRVDGWTFGWGGRVRATSVPGQPSLRATVRLHTEGTRQLEGTLRHYWYPLGGLRAGLEVERLTTSNDTWIRSAPFNTLSYLFGGGDFRDYYRAERAALVVGAVEREGWTPSLRLGWEEASSLRARPLAVLFDEDSDVRPNPAVDDGTTWSAEASLTYRRRRAGSRLTAGVRAEVADSTVAGDFSFVLGEARLAWRRPAFQGHFLELYAIARGDLAGSLPRQRWSAIGGSGTLPTLAVLERRGGRMFFTSATYVVPVEPLRVPVLGPPELFLRNAVGAAWTEGGTLRVEDNVVLGARFLALEAGVAVNPTEADLEAEVVVGARFPARFWR